MSMSQQVLAGTGIIGEKINVSRALKRWKHKLNQLIFNPLIP